MARLSLQSLLLVALFLTAVFAPLSYVLADDASPATPEEAKPADPFSAEDRSKIAATEEKHEFQAEVHRLMDIIINSLYSKREIFVRELISNAADALDKIRYLALTNQTSIGEGDSAKLEIKIEFDKDAKTLTFTDSGVGMTKKDLIKNLGIVAKSGTSEFVSEAAKGTDALALIGQFGVGFYSVYLAADKVTVISKHNDDVQHVWESTADRTFTVSEDPRGNTLGRGTQVILHLKEDAQSEFTNENDIKKIVSRYSEFINYPIYLHVSKQVDKEVPIEEAEKTEEEKAAADSEEPKEKKEGEDEEGGEELEVSEDDETEEKKPKTKTIKETVWNWDRLNDVKAIWTRNPKDITDEEYQAFYKALTKEEQPFLNKIHFTAEGEITFRAILYVPHKAPAGMYDKFYERSTALKLYVRRVLISDEFDDFLPRYLNFVKGVVDSEDLPLNVSRETLAQSRVLKVMAKKLTRKVLELLKKMSDDQEKKKGEKDEDEGEEAAKEDGDEKDKDAEDDKKKGELYTSFWDNYGKSIKLGVIDDRANKAKLSKLLRFQTTKSEGKSVSLESYVERMSSKQKYIYYITGENLEQVRNSPFLEKLVKKGFEVVFMVDPLDEYLVQSLTEFDGTNLMSITKEGLKLGDDDKERLDKYKEEFKPLTEWLKSTYGGKVEKVVVSNRIAKSPMVLVTGQYGWSSNMERIMAAQTFANAQDASHMLSKKTLEINPLHPIIRELKAKSEADPADKLLIDLANLLYDATLLQSGFVHKEPNDFATRIHRVVATGLNLDPNAEADEEEEDTTTETESESADKSDSEEEPSSESHDHEEL